ncbi:hypothetical protein [Amycolatopsis sp. NPDC004378]
MTIEGDVRPVRGLMVAASSPAGGAADAINDLTRHLPDPGTPAECSTCPGQFWPCQYFHDAAFRVHRARLRVGDVVPLELHPRLWPPQTSPDPRAWPSHTPDKESDRG